MESYKDLVLGKTHTCGYEYRNDLVVTRFAAALRKAYTGAETRTSTSIIRKAKNEFEEVISKEDCKKAGFIYCIFHAKKFFWSDEFFDRK